VNWTEFNIHGKVYCCRHLAPSVLTVPADIDDTVTNVTLRVTYSNHCFTDEKEFGPRLFREKRGRYWSHERYEASKDLPGILAKALMDNHYCVPHRSGENEQYHYIEAGEYAIFFNINKPDGTTNELKVKIASAYPLEEWGKAMVPKGSPHKLHFVMQQKLKGLSVLSTEPKWRQRR